MGDDQGRSLCRHCRDGRLNEPFRLRVHTGRGLIEDKHFGFVVQGPRYADALARCEAYMAESGAMGIVINHPLNIPVSEILKQLDIEEIANDVSNASIYLGGPVNGERGFVLHEHGTRWDSTLDIENGISVTTSRDILEAIASGNGPARTLIALGYAGWAGGQLEQELAENAWLAVPADKAIIFDLPPEQRWDAAAAGYEYLFRHLVATDSRSSRS